MWYVWCREKARPQNSKNACNCQRNYLRAQNNEWYKSSNGTKEPDSLGKEDRKAYKKI